MTSTPPAITVLGPATVTKGYAHGLRQPSLRVYLALNLTGREAPDVERLNAWMQAELSAAVAPLRPGEQLAGRILHAVLRWTRTIQQAAHLPVFEQGRVLQVGAPTQAHYAIVCPSFEGGHAATIEALRWVVGATNLALAGRETEAFGSTLPPVLAKQRSLAAPGSNTLPFLRAAYERGIPWIRLAGNAYQFGYGRCARWLDSSFTDITPQMSAVLVRNKLYGAAVMRQAGLPVPAHLMVANAEEAVRGAQQLGYPVVVKPADKDGGVGVAAGLKNAQAVVKAYGNARQYSTAILVEKHVQGRDYRLTVFNGQLVWAIERVPGGVTGDGIQTISALLAALNANPNRGLGASSPLKRLALDEEALALLTESGLTLDSVPASDRFVRLRGAANIASGGTPVGVFHQVHADNRRLAERAAQLFRLDLAGIDLLIPDIRQSWLETGAAICEVNAQPNLGQTTASHLYGQLLAQLVKGDGRVPIVVMLGAEPSASETSLVELAANATGKCVGRARNGAAWVANERITGSPLDAYAGARALLHDARVDIILLWVNDPAVFGAGLPFDRFDLLLVDGAGWGLPLAQPSDHRALRRLVADLAGACRGQVLMAAEPSVAPHITSPRHASLVAALVQQMVPPEKRVMLEPTTAAATINTAVMAIQVFDQPCLLFRHEQAR